jgi:AbiV family abortive infection protein
VTISEQTLLEGAWWAMEQAGRLITAAVTVHDGGDPSTGAALALFSREEVGRSKILRELASKVRSGAQCTRKELRNAVEVHLRKQEVGAHFITTGDDPELVAAFRAWGSAADYSVEKRNADDHLNSLLQKKRDDLPARRHKFRVASLYVDLDDTGKGWKLPRRSSPGGPSLLSTKPRATTPWRAMYCVWVG